MSKLLTALFFITTNVYAYNKCSVIASVPITKPFSSPATQVNSQWIKRKDNSGYDEKIVITHYYKTTYDIVAYKTICKDIYNKVHYIRTTGKIPFGKLLPLD